MQFLHPEFFYGFLGLLIPLFIHLFQLRRFKTEVFSNVKLLQRLELKSRKSSKLKQWLALILRMLIIACLVLAFAQPVRSKNGDVHVKTEWVIYLDNSYSMEANGPKGELLQRAIQDIITSFSNQENLSIFTNTQSFPNQSLYRIKDELLNINYVSDQLSLETIALKGKSLFSSSKTSLKNFIVISDFQKRSPNPDLDTNINWFFVPLQPVSLDNDYIESAYISNTTNSNLELTVNCGSQLQNDSLIVSLILNDKLVSKSVAKKSTNYNTSFIVPKNQHLKGKFSISDQHLQYDNHLYFDLKKNDLIRVMSINEADDTFLKKIYTNIDFKYTSTSYATLDFSLIPQQHFIVLNELTALDSSLASILTEFVENGGKLVIIPPKQILMESYNKLLYPLAKIKLLPFNPTQSFIRKINFDHSIFKKVFLDKVTNFQYPSVQGFYPLESVNGTPLLEHQESFLMVNNGVYLFSSPLNETQSNFINSPLVVPSFFNMAKSALNQQQLYYSSGEEKIIEFDNPIQKDQAIKLINTPRELIPIQSNTSTRIAFKMDSGLMTPGTYSVVFAKDTITTLSYNVRRFESDLEYPKLINYPGQILEANQSNVLDTIKSNTDIEQLWKWFAIFALVFLAIEMLTLKYFK